MVLTQVDINRDISNNLQEAIAGETHEFKNMYPAMIEAAKAEGEKAAVRSFSYANEVEKVHAALYEKALSSYERALQLSPDDPALLSLFLDADDPEIVAEAIRKLGERHASGEVQISRGIKSQLRVLEQSTDDDVAYEAEELLARL